MSKAWRKNIASDVAEAYARERQKRNQLLAQQLQQQERDRGDRIREIPLDTLFATSCDIEDDEYAYYNNS